MTTYDVFLSHSSVDKAWVQQLADALQRHNIHVWLDCKNLTPGDLIVPELEDALAQSRVVVLVVSPESVASGWVQEEYARAVGLHKRVIPVVLRDAEMPGFLQNRHRVDFRDASQYEASVRQLLRGIQAPAAVATRPMGERFELAIALRESRGRWEHRFSRPQDPDFIRPDLQCPDPRLLFGYPPELITGEDLFALLFGSDVPISRAILGAACGGVPSAAPTDHQLRLHVCTDDVRLVTLPWARLADNGTCLAEGGWTVELHPAGERGFPALPPHLCLFPGKVVLAHASDGGPQAAAHSRDVRSLLQRTWPRAQAPVLAQTPEELAAALGAGSPRLFYYYGPATPEGLLLDGLTGCMPWATLADLLRRARSVSVVWLNLLGEASLAALPQARHLLVGDGAVLVQCNARQQASQAAQTVQPWLQHVFAADVGLDPVQALYRHGYGQRVSWTGYASWQTIAPRVLTMPDLINLLLDRWRQRAVLLRAKVDFRDSHTRYIYHTVALGTAGCRVQEFPETASQDLQRTKDEREVILYHPFRLPTKPQPLDDLVRQRLHMGPRQSVLEALLPPDYRSGQDAWFLVLGWLIQTPLPANAATGALLRSVAEWCRTALLPELLRLGQKVQVRVLSVVALEAASAADAPALEEQIRDLIDAMNDDATFHWDTLERLAGVQRQDLVRYFQDKELCQCADRDRPEFPALLLAGRRDMPFDEAVATLRRGTPDNWENLFLELSTMRDAGTWPPPQPWRADFWEVHDGR